MNVGVCNHRQFTVGYHKCQVVIAVSQRPTSVEIKLCWAVCLCQEACLAGDDVDAELRVGVARVPLVLERLCPLVRGLAPPDDDAGVSLTAAARGMHAAGQRQRGGPCGGVWARTRFNFHPPQVSRTQDATAGASAWAGAGATASSVAASTNRKAAARMVFGNLG